ncbi:hypothetical protein LCGC14_3098280, partial [marine sediment metagenome]
MAEKCPACGAKERKSDTVTTTFECGSVHWFDGKFDQTNKCKNNEIYNLRTKNKALRDANESRRKSIVNLDSAIRAMRYQIGMCNLTKALQIGEDSLLWNGYQWIENPESAAREAQVTAEALLEKG